MQRESLILSTKMFFLLLHEPQAEKTNQNLPLCFRIVYRNEIWSFHVANLHRCEARAMHTILKKTCSCPVFWWRSCYVVLIGLLRDILLLRFLYDIAGVATFHSRHIKVLLVVRSRLHCKKDNDSFPCLLKFPTDTIKCLRDCCEHKLTEKHSPFIL